MKNKKFKKKQRNPVYVTIIRPGLLRPIRIIKEKYIQRFNTSQRLFYSKKLMLSTYSLKTYKNISMFYDSISTGSTRQNNIISRLATRLDTLVVQLHFAPSLPIARKYIRNGYIKVNSTIITNPDYFVSVGSEIKSTNINSMITIIRNKYHRLPSYLIANTINPLTGILLDTPRLRSHRKLYRYIQRYAYNT